MDLDEQIKSKQQDYIDAINIYESFTGEADKKTSSDTHTKSDDWVNEMSNSLKARREGRISAAFKIHEEASILKYLFQQKNKETEEKSTLYAINENIKRIDTDVSAILQHFYALEEKRFNTSL